jgi:hypothetical protein
MQTDIDAAAPLNKRVTPWCRAALHGNLIGIGIW